MVLDVTLTFHAPPSQRNSRCLDLWYKNGPLSVPGQVEAATTLEISQEDVAMQAKLLTCLSVVFVCVIGVTVNESPASW